MALAMLLSALALLLAPVLTPGRVGIAAAAAGIGIGTKLTMLVPIAVLTVVVLVLAGRARRWPVALAWLGGLTVTGSFWYLRNLFLVGSPLPSLRLPGLPSVRSPVIDAYGRTVAHYLDDGWFVRDVLPDGLHAAFGRTWPLLLIVAIVGLGLAVVARWRPRGALLLAPTAVIGAIAYTITPASAYGLEGNPVLFPHNLRYVLPAITCAVVLAALTAARARAGLLWSAVVLGSILLLTLMPTGSSTPIHEHPIVVAAGTLVAGALLGWWLASANPRWSLVLGGLAAVAIAGFVVLQGRYLDERYAHDPVGSWARGVRDAHIALASYPNQYSLYGLDLSNRVTYVGTVDDNGEFSTPRTCAAWRQALAGRGYDYVVTGRKTWGLLATSELEWTAGMPSAHVVLHIDRGQSTELAVFQLDFAGEGAADVASCGHVIR
jgi:hypothetical protein